MKKLGKVFYVVLGLITMSLGIIGIWVPGLPTTVFILVALWAFSRSSQRLHSWLSRLPILKTTMKQIEQFKKDSSLPLRVKIIAQAFAWGSFLMVVYFYHDNLITVGLVGVAALSCTIFMVSVPTRRKLVGDVANDANISTEVVEPES